MFVTNVNCIQSAEEVASIVQSVEPSGLTPMGSRLQSILGAYLDTYKRVGPDGTKRLNLIVITDGKPGTSRSIEPLNFLPYDKSKQITKMKS